MKISWKGIKLKKFRWNWVLFAAWGIPAGIMLVQAIFNTLGTVDILPLTGVTFPFLSNGGSSMLCSWGLLAFIKASDTRQNASFAVRQSREGRITDE